MIFNDLLFDALRTRVLSKLMGNDPALVYLPIAHQVRTPSNASDP